MEDSRIFKCYVCNENFDQYGLELHYATTHAIEEENDKSQDNNRCEQCGKCFTRKDNLNKHIKKIHKGRKNHECEHCGKCFRLKTNLSKHCAATHAFEEKNNKSQDNRCEECGKCFTRIDNLNKHIKKFHKGRKVHVGRKDHKCDSCGKCFGQKKTSQSTH